MHLRQNMCRHPLDLRPHSQSFRRVASKIKLRYALCGLGALIALLEFCGAFVHPFEISYDESFAYPYVSSTRELVSALRRNEKPAVGPVYGHERAFLLDQSQKCREKEGDAGIRLVYLVKSELGNFDRRIAIRSSWGIETRFFDMPTRTVFVVGARPNDANLDARLRLEAAFYKDVVQADIVDSYHDLAVKTMMGFKWLAKYCSNSEFYMFVDDDMYVSMKNVATFIRNPVNYPLYLMKGNKVHSAHKREIKQSDLTYREETGDNIGDGSATYNSEISNTRGKRKDTELSATASNRTKREARNFDPPNRTTRMFAGYVFARSSPQRHKFSERYVSWEEYPYDFWPPYVTGGAYILSREALLDMYYTSLYTRYIRFDDIYLGLIAKKADIMPFHCDEFHSYYKKPYTEHGYKYVIASRGYEDSDKLLKVWTEQKALGNA